VPPGKDSIVRVDGNRGAWQSSATFRSDAQGRVEIADPMRLVWSATGERPLKPVPSPIQPWVFTAEVDGKVIATHTLNRRAIAQSVRVVPVRERGLVGMAYSPAESGPRPAIIVLPGSQGGVLGTGAHAGGLASRGGELSLLLGATYPSAFRVVVANVPSNVVGPGLGSGAEAPAWTLDGKAVPRAEIPVERIRAPVLLLAGKDDQLWPSATFAARVVERLRRHKFAYPVEHYSYEHAGHGITRPYVPTSVCELCASTR
jgi:dienelactone hydrolase